MPDLFGEESRKEKRRKRVKKTTRTQCRAETWQDANDPSVSYFALFAEDTDDLIRGLPVYLQDVARHVLDHLEKPVTLPSGTPPNDARDVMSVVYRLRFHHRAQLRIPGDPTIPPDFVTALKEISTLYSEEMLAEKGFRSAAHGISAIRDASGHIKGYRVQAWGEIHGDGEPRAGHIHIGYAREIEKARKILSKWWLEQRGIDLGKLINWREGSAIADLSELMRSAAANAGDTVELPPWDDEDD